MFHSNTLSQLQGLLQDWSVVTAQASRSYGLVTVTRCISGGNTWKDQKPCKLAGLENTNNHLMPLPLPSLSHHPALAIYEIRKDLRLAKRIPVWKRLRTLLHDTLLFIWDLQQNSSDADNMVQCSEQGGQPSDSLPVSATEALWPQAGLVTSVPCLPVCKMGIILLTYLAGGLGVSVS